MIKRELAIFLIVGSLTVLIDFLIYRGLVRFDLIGVDWAKGISFLVGTAFAYLANRIWTFGHKRHEPGSVWRFIFLYAVTLGVNVAINAWALSILGNETMGAPLSFVLATGGSALLNFLGMKWFVFKTKLISESL